MRERGSGFSRLGMLERSSKYSERASRAETPSTSLIPAKSSSESFPTSWREPRVPAPKRGASSAAHTSTPNRPSRSFAIRSEEHTSELQSRQYLVCRLLLEKKK